MWEDPVYCGWQHSLGRGPKLYKSGAIKLGIKGHTNEQACIHFSTRLPHYGRLWSGVLSQNKFLLTWGDFCHRIFITATERTQAHLPKGRSNDLPIPLQIRSQRKASSKRGRRKDKTTLEAYQSLSKTWLFKTNIFMVFVNFFKFIIWCNALIHSKILFTFVLIFTYIFEFY